MKNNKFNRLMVLGFAVVSTLSFVGCSTTEQPGEVVLDEQVTETVGNEAANEGISKEDLIKSVYGDDSSWAESTLSLIGKPAPDFKFTDSEGVTKSISDFKGKPLILDIMTTTCPTCEEVQGILEEFKKTSDIPVISVSYNETREMLNKSDYAHPTSLISTTEVDLVDLYKLAYTPSLIYIDAEGIVQFSLIGSTDLETVQYVAAKAFSG